MNSNKLQHTSRILGIILFSIIFFTVFYYFITISPEIIKKIGSNDLTLSDALVFVAISIIVTGLVLALPRKFPPPPPEPPAKEGSPGAGGTSG